MVALAVRDIKVEQITTEVRRITPRDAERFLGHNTHNRIAKKTAVARMAGAMRRGEWLLNGESIKFAQDGRLIDGQHRLQAIIESGVAIDTVVVHGLAGEAQDTVDIGVKRSTGDILRLNGYVDTNVLGAAITFLLRMESHQWYSGAGYISPTPQEILNVAARNPGLHESVRVGSRLGKRIRGPRSLMAALHYRFSQIDAIDADSFFDRLTTGENLTAGNPIYALRRWLEQTAAQNKVVTNAIVYAVTVKAWNAFRHNEQMEIARFRRGIEQLPEPE